MTRQTVAADLRQVTLACRLGVIDQGTAADILESILDARELHEQTERYRLERERREYLAPVLV